MDKSTTTEKLTFIKDSDWSTIDGEFCRIIGFVPFGSSVKDGKVQDIGKSTPYASVTLECKKFSNKITGHVTHKMDFAHLWAAFKERGIKENEEVVIFWSKKHLKTFAKIFSLTMPKLWVMICPKGAFELMTDPNFKPELSGEARWNAQKPIAEWKPEVTK